MAPKMAAKGPVTIFFIFDSKKTFMILATFCESFRLGPRVKKIKNGYPESSKVCYSIILKKNIWCIRNHCIANFSELHNVTRANKVW